MDQLFDVRNLVGLFRPTLIQQCSLFSISLAIEILFLSVHRDNGKNFGRYNKNRDIEKDLFYFRQLNFEKSR